MIERRSRHLMYTAFAPMLPISVKPSDKLIMHFYATLGQQIQLYLDHDGNFRGALGARFRLSGSGA